MALKSWFNVANQTSDSADVEIYDEIGGFGVSAREFVKSLRGLEGKHINLRINSPGGSIIDGQAIITALKRHAAGFTAWVDGLAASMASVIACAAQKCYMADGAMMMIHRASTVSMGDAEDLRKDADLLEKFEKGLVNVYATKTGMEAGEIAKMLDAETWLDSLEAVALGFADGITDNSPAMAKVSPSDLKARFDNFRLRMEANESPAVETAPEVAVESVTDAPTAEPVVETAPEAPVAEPEAAPAPEAAEPDAPAVEIAVEPVAQAKATDILNKYNAAVARAEAAEAKVNELAAEVASVKAVLDAERSALEALERSLGLAAAKVEPLIKPNAEVRASLLEQFEAITDPEAKARFYAKNRKGILAAV